MAYPYIPPAGNICITVNMADVGAVASAFIAPGFDGRIKRLNGAVFSAITGANSVVTTKIGGTAVTGGVLTVLLSGAAAGNVSSAVPSALNVFRSTDAIEFASDGGASNSAVFAITAELEPI
jgi:hypothetical protein